MQVSGAGVGSGPPTKQTGGTDENATSNLGEGCGERKDAQGTGGDSKPRVLELPQTARVEPDDKELHTEAGGDTGQGRASGAVPTMRGVVGEGMKNS